MRWIVLGIFLSITTQQIACKSDDNGIWRFEVDIPEVLRAIKKYTGLSIADAGKKKRHGKNIERSGPDFLSKTVKLEVTPPDFQGMFRYIKNLVGNNRRNDFFSYVEMGPGYYKTPTEYYPKDYLKGKLLNLLKIQEEKKVKEEKLSDLDIYNQQQNIFE